MSWRFKPQTGDTWVLKHVSQLPREKFPEWLGIATPKRICAIDYAQGLLWFFHEHVPGARAIDAVMAPVGEFVVWMTRR